MRCPFCNHSENKVVDSRMSEEGQAIRRRRECLRCARRFTTYERVDAILPSVIKKDGRREPFDRQKILLGLKKACQKRPVSMDTLEGIADRIEKKVQDLGKSELHSRIIGEEVMNELHQLDPVAFVRFASVYREFKDVSEFMRELKDLLKDERNSRAK